MFNMLRAEIFRHGRRKAALILPLLGILALALISYLFHLITQRSIVPASLENYIELIFQVSMIGAVIAPIVIVGNQSKERGIHQQNISFGSHRLKLFGTDVLMSLLQLTAFTLLFGGIAYGLANLQSAGIQGSMDAWAMGQNYLLTLLLFVLGLAACMSVLLSLNTLLNNKSYAAGLYFLIVWAAPGILLNLSLFEKKGGFLVKVLLFYARTAPSNLLSDLISQARDFTHNGLAAFDHGKYLLVMASYLVISFILGALVYQRRDY